MWIVIEDIDGHRIGLKRDSIESFWIEHHTGYWTFPQRREKITELCIRTRDGKVWGVKTDLKNVCPFADELNRGARRFYASQVFCEDIAKRLNEMSLAKLEDEVREKERSKNA